MKKIEVYSYERELKKAVHAFNEKIRYHENKGATHLPERQSFAELNAMLTTKKDYTKTIEEFRAFGKKDAQKAVQVSEKLTVSAWEKKIVEKQVGTINRSRKAKKAAVDKLEATNSGKPLGYKRGEMSTNRTAELVDKKLNWEKVRSRSELEMYKKTLKYQTTQQYWKEKNERVKLNYIQGLYNTYGARADGLIKKISDMSDKDFVKKFNSDQNATITFMYEPLDEDTKLDALEMIWLEDEETGDLDISEYFEI